MRRVTALILVVWLGALCGAEAERKAGDGRYRWLGSYDAGQAIAGRIGAPGGCERVEVEAGSFGDWLRNLPLKPGRPPVLLFDGGRKENQEAHVAVLNLDVGNTDLQQCADSIIRLRAEYLFSAGRGQGGKEIAFHFTSGDLADWGKWSGGYRPVVRGNSVKWNKTAGSDGSYGNFRKYLDVVFTYAGTRSLAGEMKRMGDGERLAIGDVLVRGGSPGHAVIVVDMAKNPASGKTYFLLAQGYMPAQEMHVLKNPKDEGLSPWYDSDFGEVLRTPEWKFGREDRRRF